MKGSHLWNGLIQILPKRILVDATSALPISFPSPGIFTQLPTLSTCDFLVLNSLWYAQLKSEKAKNSGKLMFLGASLRQWWMELEDKGPGFLIPQSAAILRSILHFPRSPQWDWDPNAPNNNLLLNTPYTGFFPFLSHFPTLTSGYWNFYSK